MSLMVIFPSSSKGFSFAASAARCSAGTETSLSLNAALVVAGFGAG